MFSHTTPSGLVLRPLEPRHAPEVFALLDGHRNEFDTYLRFLKGLRTVEDVTRFLREVGLEMVDRRALAWGLWWEGRYVGALSVGQVIQPERIAELAYYLDPGVRGRGLMTEAARLMVDVLFREWGMVKVQLHCDPRNVSSAGIARRLGFTHEGTPRRAFLNNGVWCDLQLWGLLKEEWEGAVSPSRPGTPAPPSKRSGPRP